MKKILLSFLVIGLISVIVFGTTKAYFSDAATSSNNAFSAGTLDLKLNGSDSVTANWNMTNMKPGDQTTASINITNTGSIAAHHLEINNVSNTVIDTNNDATPDIDAYLEIAALSYDGTSKLADLIDANSNGWKDLDDLENSANTGEGGALDNLLPVPTAGGGTSKVFSMTLLFRQDAGNEYQADSNTLAMTFQLNQDSSQ